MSQMKRLLAATAARAGLSVRRARSSDPWHAIGRLVRSSNPVVLDVGANVGQAAQQCLRRMPRATVFSFEPSPTTYRELSLIVSALPVRTFNVGMADRPGTLTLFENDHSDMTSFLQPTDAAWGKVVRKSEVAVWTVDQFRAAEGIDRIDVLKTDTQGLDLAVLRGAAQAFADEAIDVVLTEISFQAMYQEAPRFDEVLGYLLDRRFRVAGIYPVHHENGIASWADVVLARQVLL